jgi:predicted transcriptional regulator
MMVEKPITSTSIRWPADLKAEIDELAKADDRTFSGYVIHAMREHVARERALSKSAKSRKA